MRLAPHGDPRNARQNHPNLAGLVSFRREGWSLD